MNTKDTVDEQAHDDQDLADDQLEDVAGGKGDWGGSGTPGDWGGWGDDG